LLPRVPTYTLPLATVGTVNFTEFPAASAGFLALFHSSVARLVASYACSTAGPQREACVVQPPVWSMAHTIPSLLLPEADTEGVAPGKRKGAGDRDVGVVGLILSIDVSKA